MMKKSISVNLGTGYLYQTEREYCMSNITQLSGTLLYEDAIGNRNI